MMTSQSLEKSNLGSRERRKRLIFGLVGFAGAVGLIAAGWVNSLMGWILFFALTLAGSLGLFQAKGKT